MALCALSLLPAARAAAEDAPLTAERAAALVRAAWNGDRQSIAGLAARDSPDPWLVAEALCRDEAYDAAEFFAASSPRKAVEKLPAYVKACRARGPDEALRSMWQQVSDAYTRGEHEKAIEAAERIQGAPATVPAIRAAYIRGNCLARLRAFEKAATALRDSADAARTLGWYSAALGAYWEAAGAAFRRSDWQFALAALEQVQAMQSLLGRTAGAAQTLVNMGLLHERLGRYEEAMRVQTEALALARTAGDENVEANALSNIGNVHWRQSRYRLALAFQLQALAIWTKRKDQASVAFALGRVALVEEALGDIVGARDRQSEALAIYQRLGHEVGIARTMANIGRLHQLLGDLPRALATQRDVLARKRTLKDRAGEALALTNIGAVYHGMGNFTQSLMHNRRAVDMARTLRDRASEAGSLVNVGVDLAMLGRYADALRTFEASMAIYEELEDPAGVANALGELGLLRERMGDYQAALAAHTRVLEERRRLGSRGALPSALHNLGRVHERMGESERALERQREALAVRSEVRDAAGEAFDRTAIGVSLRSLGRHEESIASLERALEIATKHGLQDAVASCHGQLGLSFLAAGERAKARTLLDQAVREAEDLRMTPIKLRFLSALARLHLDAGDPGRALEQAERGVRDLEDILGGLAEEEGAGARELYVELFSVGVLAAVALDDAGAALKMLESARAGTLLDSLNGRQGLLWAELPEALRKAEAEAKAAVAVARHQLDRARALDDYELARARLKVLDEALARMRAVSARIQRDAKRQAGVFYPRAAALGRVRAALPAGAALVIYGHCLGQCVALVVWAQGERMVRLGSAAAIVQACQQLEIEDRDEQAPVRLRALASLVVGPLRLPKTVSHVIVSPDSALCYMPFPVLFGTRRVTLTPSATTHVLLRDEEWQRGERVLALGDPVYGERVDANAAAVYVGRRGLDALPDSRAEAEAVGSDVLLGEDATEAGLVERIAKHGKRWRAVHIACHGVIDSERPTLSALALTRGKGDDGFLTCLEILRAQVPADLVVLSACDSAKGRIYRGEGIVGLMRAFMYAGAPRVLCSLWKVDDRATLALMKRFYARWNPKDGSTPLPAEDALRNAQDHVKAQPGWEHPVYWAAWVVWGLPD